MPSTSVVAVDLQSDFFDIRQNRVGRLEKALCLPGSRKLIRYAHLNKHKVVHVVTGHKDASSLPIHLIKAGQEPYCLEGTEGASNINGLFADGDLRIQKTQYSGFFGTNLDEQLLGCDSLMLCGIATDCCILQTAFDAASHRKHVYIPYQAVFATTREAYVFGLQAIAKSAGAVVDLEVLLKSPAKPWEARLRAEDIEELAGNWYSMQIGILEDFKVQRSDLFAQPIAPPQEMIAGLEAFLSARAVP